MIDFVLSSGIEKKSTSRDRLLSIVVLLCAAFVSLCSGQAVLTNRSDNARTGATITETLLTPSNVNKNSFGRLFNYAIDYQALAQPLYVPNVNIPGLGTHNVVYVATMADSVYAFDADSNQGANAAPLWHVNFTNAANGITTASVATGSLPCASTETGGPGFTQEGIVSTPVIDGNTGTLYVVAKTLENGAVRHRLHALDIATGQEKFGGPSLPLAATSTSIAGHITVFNSLHQKNRPGLLLQNGAVYIGFGSNYCNDQNTGWVLSYDAATLLPLYAFNTSPDHGLTSIWHAGNGLAGDEAGNIFAETSEGGIYDVPSGGQTYCNSVLKLYPDLTLADYFTPWSVAFLDSHDLDLSSTGPLILPDQNGPYPHEVVASGKQGFVYVLNRDALGTFSANDSLVLQEFPLIPGMTTSSTLDTLLTSPAYWNNTVYFTPLASPILAFPLSAGLLGTPHQTSSIYTGAHSPSISANGNTNGILWTIPSAQLFAFDAVSLKLLYTTTQAPNGRDKLPAISHFITQTVANGRVYVATRTTLEVYGLFPTMTVVGGAKQSATAGSTLSLPIKVQVGDPYHGVGIPGVTVTFSDGGKGGVFNPTSAVTDANGIASIPSVPTYTLPKKSGTYTLTLSSSTSGSTTTVETAVPGAPVKIVSYGGGNQSGPTGSVLPKPIVAQVRDVYNNGVSGITVNFSATGNGILNPISPPTDVNGKASTSFKLPTTVGTFYVTASSTGLTSIKFAETSVAGPAASASVSSGNNQTQPAGTQLSAALVVLVTDQYGNPVSGVNVSFNDGGKGGSFLNTNPAVTDSSGKASQSYVLPSTAGTVTINATAGGVASPAVFTETAQ